MDLEKFFDRVNHDVLMARKVGDKRVLCLIRRYLQGGVFEELDGWIRRRLRNIIWRQWKRPYARAKNLMRLGLSEERACKSATTGHGPWWNSGASHMNQAFPKKYFDTLGLVSLQASMLTMNRRGTEPYARWCKRGEL